MAFIKYYCNACGPDVQCTCFVDSDEDELLDPHRSGDEPLAGDELTLEELLVLAQSTDPSEREFAGIALEVRFAGQEQSSEFDDQFVELTDAVDDDEDPAPSWILDYYR